MLARDHLSAILITSSGLRIIPVPGVITYSASKSLASYLAIGLSYELEGKIDVMSWTLGMTDTKLLGNRRGSSRVATRKEAVDGMLKDLGKERDTMGCTRHDGTLFFDLAPRGWLSRMFLGGMTKEREMLLKEGKIEPKEAW